MNAHVRQFVLACLIGVGLQGPVNALSTEEAIETSTGAVTMPRTVGGALVTQPCATCATIIVRLDAHSRFFVNQRETTLADFVKVLDGGGQHSMVVFYDRNDNTISRVKVIVAGAPVSSGARG